LDDAKKNKNLANIGMTDKSKAVKAYSAPDNMLAKTVTQDKKRRRHVPQKAKQDVSEEILEGPPNKKQASEKQASEKQASEKVSQRKPLERKARKPAIIETKADKEDEDEADAKEPTTSDSKMEKDESVPSNSDVSNSSDASSTSSSTSRHSISHGSSDSESGSSGKVQELSFSDLKILLEQLRHKHKMREVNEIKDKGIPIVKKVFSKDATEMMSEYFWSNYLHDLYPDQFTLKPIWVTHNNSNTIEKKNGKEVELWIKLLACIVLVFCIMILLQVISCLSQTPFPLVDIACKCLILAIPG
jgi:hypothetical protein